MFENPGKTELETFLRGIRTVAVLGLSETPGKPSHNVAKGLQDFGLRIVPVNPSASEILGERAWPDLAAALQGAGPVDVVDVFRRRMGMRRLVFIKTPGTIFLTIQKGGK